jgi:hypothetical protein
MNRAKASKFQRPGAHWLKPAPGTDKNEEWCLDLSEDHA